MAMKKASVVRLRPATAAKWRALRRITRWSFSEMAEILVSKELECARTSSNQDAPGRMIAVNPPPLVADERK